MNLPEKYRPQTWGEVVGQDAAIADLDAIRERCGSLGGHAYWIAGGTGTGKTTIARLIAGEVAESPIWVTEMDASDLTADWLREVRHTMQLRAGQAYIVNEAHGLNRATARKLLSVLEPPGGLSRLVVWVFTTTDTGQESLFDGCDDAGPLLSRCEELYLQPARAEFAAHARDIAGREQLDGQPPAAYEALYDECEGNLRRMLAEIGKGRMLKKRPKLQATKTTSPARPEHWQKIAGKWYPMPANP